jgi:hypothetical protein
LCFLSRFLVLLGTLGFWSVEIGASNALLVAWIRWRLPLQGSGLVCSRCSLEMPSVSTGFTWCAHVFFRHDQLSNVRSYRIEGSDSQLTNWMRSATVSSCLWFGKRNVLIPDHVWCARIESVFKIIWVRKRSTFSNGSCVIVRINLLVLNHSV